mmetsp:Transcript_5200/g.7662  ORF Transcript_5200/g.7662 Transcript_5200/m.7662 type:complete len:265 (-) Transcript_5200:148-942(-)
MGCTGSKKSNRIQPVGIAANPDDILAGNTSCAWGDVAKDLREMTDEERSNNTTPPRTASEKDVSPIDHEEARTPEDVSTVTPVSLDTLLAEAESIMFPQSPSEAAAIPHWERQEPLLARPGTSSRRPESDVGRLVVYKTVAQKKAEEVARRKRLECQNESLAAGVVPRPGTANRKQSALPPLEERRRAKMRMTAPTTLPCDEVEVKKTGGASWQLDESQFLPQGTTTCASPVNKVVAKQVAIKSDVFNLDDDEGDASDLEEESL